MYGVSINLNDSLHAQTRFLQGSPTKINQAIKRALRKLIIWLQRQTLREASAESGVPQKTFKKYNRIHFEIGDMSGSVWLGTQPLPLHEVGRVSWSQRSAGVSVNGELYEGAFYKAVFSSQKKVWIRTSRNRQLGHLGYHPKGKKTGAGFDDGRFPVEILAQDLATTQRKIDSRLQGQAEARFETLLKQEINYALNVQ